MLARRRTLLPTAVKSDSAAICARLLEVIAWDRIAFLAAYAAVAGEVDVWGVAAAAARRGTGVLLARYNKDTGLYEMVPVTDIRVDTAVGQYGIREPLAAVPALSPDVCDGPTVTWLVPGVAFDPFGNRLGRGGGHYDRLLRNACGCRIGVAYDWQILPEVPHASGDVPMHVLVSERRFVRVWPSCPLTAFQGR